jgi:hypothetical protein
VCALLQKASGAKNAHESLEPRQAKGLFTRMGHDSIETTQIYLHCMKKPGLGVKSPFDQLGQWSPPPPPADPGNL